MLLTTSLYLFTNGHIVFCIEKHILEWNDFLCQMLWERKKKQQPLTASKTVKHEKYVYKSRSVASWHVFQTVRNLGQNAASVETTELEWVCLNEIKFALQLR